MWRNGRMGPAGLLLGSLAWKPQLLLIAGVALLVRPNWRLLSGVLASVFIHASLFTAVVGTQGWMAYAAVLSEISKGETVLFSEWRLQSLRGALALVFPSGPVLWVGLAAATSVVVAGCWWLGRVKDDRTAFAVAVIGGLLVSPHVYAYVGLLAFAALHLIGEEVLKRRRADSSDLWAYALYWSPIVIDTAQVTRLQPVCAAMLGWLAASIRSSVRSQRRTQVSPESPT